MPVPPVAVRPTVGAVAVPDGAPALLVHGGAWDIPDDALADHRDGLRAALSAGQAVLVAGGTALDAVCEAVAAMEAHGAFDAGRGAVLNADGEVELDAGVMDGATLAYGAVLGVRRVAAPVRLARHVLHAFEGETRMLAGAGAEAHAAAAGLALVEPSALVHPREQARYAALRPDVAFRPSQAFRTATPRGTVGAVARDRAGRLAAATSTGGTPLKPAGRVGDSPLVGCGFYADEGGAASSTGWGEAIAARLLAVRAVDRLAHAAADAVVAERLRDLHARVRDRKGEGATAGAILLGARGTAAWGFTTPRMARGAWVDGGSGWVEV